MIIVEESSDLCNYHKFRPARRILKALLLESHSQNFNSKLYLRKVCVTIFVKDLLYGDNIIAREFLII